MLEAPKLTSAMASPYDAEWGAPWPQRMMKEAGLCPPESSDTDEGSSGSDLSTGLRRATTSRWRRCPASAAALLGSLVVCLCLVAFNGEVSAAHVTSFAGAVRAGAAHVGAAQAALPHSSQAGEEAAADTQWRHLRYAEDCWGPCGGAGLCSLCGAGGACCRHDAEGDPPECGGSRFWPALTYHTCVSAAGPANAPSPAAAAVVAAAPPPEAPTFTFYLYRAQNDENRWTLGNVNIANLPGVMWYLSNEVMPRCPKRYGISRIRRYKITVKTTPELHALGMNFGVRYSYDAGKCTGSNIRWLGSCSRTWDRFGYVVGCNNFRDHYPYPLVDTEYPDGVWYDLPLEGRCDKPTGAWNCTWSYEEAGEIRLEDLEAQEPGYGYCCGGMCTDFWRGHWSAGDCDRRLSQVKELFKRRFPGMPEDMAEPPCDFDRSRFWG